ncbi:MAG: TonB-dependent receptor [Betaproteobacteria bacterium]|nr:TonB-dependent receptor [Betaproteobacteria bacterium]
MSATPPTPSCRCAGRRWSTLLLRGSYNTGFRAPSFFQLYGAEAEAPMPGNIADPVLCPDGPTAPNADLSVCAIRPQARQGGNPACSPRRPASGRWVSWPRRRRWLSFSVDLWEIQRDDLIFELRRRR